MKTIINNKNYYKEKKEVQTAIRLGSENLKKRITVYKEQNIPFEKIFNDDYVKYDKHGDFYTFKYQRNNMQIRILYAYFTIGEEEILLISEYYIKKRTDNNYIKQFDKANNLNPIDSFNLWIMRQEKQKIH